MRLWAIETVATFLLGVLVQKLAPSYLPLMCLLGLLFLTCEGLRELAKMPSAREVLRKSKRRVGKPMSIVMVSLIGIGFANLYWWAIQSVVPAQLPLAASLLEIKSFGMKPPNLGYVRISGAKLNDYRERFRLIAIVRATDFSRDLIDDPNIVKSEVFRIPEGDLEINIPVKQEMMDRSSSANAGMLSLDFSVVHPSELDSWGRV